MIDFQRYAHLAALGVVCCLTVSATESARGDDSEAIRLIVRADDIGSSHAANIACIRSYREGIARSVEVMVPAPWFNEAVKMLNENSAYDVGVHLTLTSEWENVKWRPLTASPSLVDSQGDFYPSTSQRADFPSGTGFLQAEPDLKEVEHELRAQIQLAMAKIENVTHLTCHMGTPVCTPEMRAIVNRLADEYKLPVELPNVRRFPRWSGGKFTSAEKEENLASALGTLTPGLWLLVEHPGLDTAEMQAIGHKGYENVAADRQGVTDAFTSKQVSKVIQQRNIQLVSYGDVLKP